MTQAESAREPEVTAVEPPPPQPVVEAEPGPPAEPEPEPQPDLTTEEIVQSLPELFAPDDPPTEPPSTTLPEGHSV